MLLTQLSDRPDLLHPIVRAALRAALDGDRAHGPLLAERSFGEDDLALDSLERWRFGAALIELLHLDETGGDDYVYVSASIAQAAETVAKLLALRTETRLSFRTSGTTSGDGAAVVHDAAFLARESAAVFAALEAPPTPTIGLAASALHLFGFQNGAAAAAATGGRVVDLSTRGAPRFDDLDGLDILVATPAHLEHLSTIARGRPLPGAPIVVSSSFPLSDGLAARIRALGARRIVDLYGSTETAAIGRRRVGCDADFTLLAHLKRDGDRLVDRADGRSIDPPDRLRWTGSDRFALGGRADMVIKVAGRRIDLAPLHAALSPVFAGQDWLIALRADAATHRCAVLVDPAAEDRAALTERAGAAIESALDGAAGVVDLRFSDLRGFRQGKPGRIVQETEAADDDAMERRSWPRAEAI